MVRLMSRVRDVVSEERGVVLVLTALMFVSFLGIAALVVDIVIVNLAQLRAQATADSAVLAAAQDIDDIPVAILVAKEYALRNYGVVDADWAGCVDSAALSVPTTVNCISIDDAVAPSHIRVRIPNRIVGAIFGGIYGRFSFSISAAATAETEGFAAPAGPIIGDPDDLGAEIRAGDPGGGYDQCENYDNGNIFGNWATTTENKWAESAFVFEHLDGTVTVLCDTSLNEAEAGGWGQWATWFPDAGGASATSPTGVELHVSCSDNFIDGWATPPQGPLEGIDTEWRIVRYTIVKYNQGNPQSQCGKTFTPVTSEGPGPVIRLSD